LWFTSGLSNLRLKKRAGKVYGLRSLIKLICFAEILEDDVESIQKRDPVIEVAPRKRPSCGEGWEMLWQEG
jgi:hypothetical protein